MPTVKNVLNVQGGTAKAIALLDFIADQRHGQGSVDFNRITPIPTISSRHQTPQTFKMKPPSWMPTWKRF